MKNNRLGAGLAASLLLIGTLAFAGNGLPPDVQLPPGIEVAAGALSVEAFGEAEFPLAEGKNVLKQGKHYRSYLAFSSGTNPGAAAVWKQMLPLFTQKGFKVAGNDGASTYTLTRGPAGGETWLRIALADYNDPLLEIIETKSLATAYVLPKPAARPETFGDADDFPYLPRYPGTKLVQSVRHAEPLDVTVPGVDGEPLLQGSGYIVKRYAAPSTLSRLEFDQTVREALTKSGWTVRALAPGARAGEQTVVASYTRDGRQLFATLRRADPTSDQGIEFAVADTGAEDWARKLDSDCRLPLYGVHFDFAKSTLRPESEPVLQKVAALLQSRPALSVEIQGHTDNVGGDDDNQRLSEARARSVTGWLVDHGIAATRLESKGYGRKVPVASNDDDAGRARNRRVELRKRGCAK